MKVYLFLMDKIVDFVLPSEVSGSFSFDVSEEENKLINIEAREGRWVLYQTSDVKVLSNNMIVDGITLVPENFYGLRRDNVNYIIYVTMVNLPNLVSYGYDNKLNMIIGNNDSANVRYNCSLLKSSLIKIHYVGDNLILEHSNDINIYVNKKSLFSNNYVIRSGDEIQIFSLKMIFLKNIVFINKINNLIIADMAVGLSRYVFPIDNNVRDFDIKDVDLYSKNDYVSKSPRIRRTIETKKIKLSAPPRDGNNGEMPLLLVIGPMLTMGIVSAITILNTTSKLISKEATMKDSWPSLVSGIAMLISMIAWPLITQAYNRKMKKKKQKEIIDKYTSYLNEKKEELLFEAKQQKVILTENLITVEECLNIIRYRNINFWSKRIDQSDFLILRIGVGNELLDAKIEYPDEDFTIEESELRKKSDALVEEFKYITDVPIGYSFYENKTTAIMGSKDKTFSFMNNLLLQLITFYNYEDLKIVLFTCPDSGNNWEYLKYLNHSFTNDKTFRFYASDIENTKNVAEYLSFEVNNRSNMPAEKIKSLKPYYFIIIDCYDKVKHYDFIKQLTEADDNLGFSLVILENRLSKLPSKCNNFINIDDNNSGILKNSYEKQEQIAFKCEINNNINMMALSKLLSNIPVELEEGSSILPNAVTFLEMEKVGKVEQLNILNRWNMNDATTSLKAEVGVDEQGDLMYLDLHEKFHGPHGLIAGMTGSGKSEFIITYILSMAINYSPDDVAFILIDYKGGGLAFAFENKTTGVVLPHLAGTITNLDKAEMDRTLVSIDSEIKRRQHIFNEARDTLGESTIDIYKYQRFYKEGKLSEPIPHLFIVCDEFAELKSQQPDFMDNLISVARIGRSLGVHLILATQKPSGVVNDQIWSNTKFRVCLKVQDESDSREMLKRPEAASLKQTGRFYLQVGFDEYFALGQSGWCGAKYYPSEKIVKQVDKSVNFINDCGLIIKSIQASNGIKVKAQGEQLSAILNSIIDVSNMVKKRTRKLWLENIPEIILENYLVKKYNFIFNPYNVEAIIGEYDAPESQSQGLAKYNFLNNGNTIIYGNDGSENEHLLSTIIYSSTRCHKADELNYYIIDYGSEMLRRFVPLPHVGGFVSSGDDEKFHNLFKLIKEELQKRKKLFVEYGGEYTNYIKSSSNKLELITIIINNYDSFYEANPNIYDELPDLIRDSERYGIVFILTGNGVNSIQNKVAQNCHNIYAFKLKDSSDYISLFDVRTKLVPRSTFGRGLLKVDGVHEFQTASIVNTDTDLNEYISKFIDYQKQNNTFKAPMIPVLPDIVKLDNVKEYITNLNSVPVGISKSELDVQIIDFLSNIGYIITSNKLTNTNSFVKSLLSILINLNVDLIIIDPIQMLDLNKEVYSNYFNSDIDNIINYIIEYLEKLISMNSDLLGTILIYGLDKFVSKVSDVNSLNKMSTLLKKYEKISIIIVDDAPKIKRFTFENWFNGLFSVNDGIWIGRGISDQNLLHLSQVTKEMTLNYKNDMGYVVSDGLGVLCKFIDFISEDDVCE